MEACQEPDMQDMAPAVALMLWCGVRPTEVQRQTWDDINSRAGLHDWQQDTLRHTFASYHLRRFANMRHLTATDTRRFWCA